MKDSASLIGWIKAIQNKNQCFSNVFGIENSYPSVPSELLTKAISFTSEIAPSTTDELF